MDSCQAVFKAGNHNKLAFGIQYLTGLFQAQKRNMERMVERVIESEYYSIQHFISESPWDARAGFDKVAADTSELFAPFERVGLLIDESSHPKKGRHSVGVSRQYCGTTGKIDNCQVAVYAALSTGNYYGLIDTALFLPQDWIGDEKRCDKAGVPVAAKGEKRVFKTKVELALDMVKHQQQIGTRFHFVGADGLYGNSYELQAALDKLGLLFVLDIHSDQYVYTEPPLIAVPEKRAVRGRQPVRYKATGKVMEVRKLIESVASGSWEKICLRQTGKGDLRCEGYKQKVYVWDGKSGQYAERVLVTRRMQNKDSSYEYKYALSNAAEGQYSTEELVQMQSQRYFVERSFQEAKQEAGMSQYQVRGWLAWHHHMVMVMMALHFILSEKILLKDELPLLSAYDVREIMLNVYPRKGATQQEIMQQIHKRHQQRKIQYSQFDSS